MSIEILMPALSPTMTEGTLAKWLKKEGESVAIGDIIAEIETDKATMELESVEEGVLAKILVPEGSKGVQINSLIAVLAEDGEDWQKLEVFTPAAVSAPSNPPLSAPTQSVASASAVPANPASAIASISDESKAKGRIFASPLARRIAKSNNIDLSLLQGTGPRGRIIQRDVEAFIAAGGAQSSKLDFAARNIDEKSILALYDEKEYDLVPHDTMRKVIAKRLVESKQFLPHFYVAADCNLDKLLLLREEINANAPTVSETNKPAYKISINDMVIKAAGYALNVIPEANVSWLNDAMIKHKNANIAVAVAIENGLITPIIKHVEQKSIKNISNEMKDLIVRAKERRLKPEEYQGGSASISNLGMFGVKNFSAIVNPPQSVIFAIGASRKVPVISEDGSFAAGNIMSVTISVDHRAIDGAVAAELLREFQKAIENPTIMLV